MNTRHGSETKFFELNKKLALAKRQLQIENSLEKVRSTAMTMRTSSDVQKIAKVLFHELKKFGFEKMSDAQIIIYDKNETSFLNFIYSSDSGASTVKWEHDNQLVKDYVRQMRNGRSFSIFVMAGAPLKVWRKQRQTQIKKEGLLPKKAKALHHYFFNIGKNSIGISAIEQLTTEELRILHQFKTVFKFAFQRYADIARLEAQSREEQVETALENVRARALAMRKSSELKNVVSVLYDQLQKLEFGIEKGAAVVITYTPESDDHTQWIADARQSYASPFYVQHTDYPIPNDLLKTRRQKLDFFARLYTAQEKNEYFRY
jgi:hypothetical protein